MNEKLINKETDWSKNVLINELTRIMEKKRKNKKIKGWKDEIMKGWKDRVARYEVWN